MPERVEFEPADLAAHAHHGERVLDRALEAAGQFGDAEIREDCSVSLGGGFHPPCRNDTARFGGSSKRARREHPPHRFGGREHALAWSISASPLMTKLYCAPGNAGIAEIAECVPIEAMAIDRLVEFAQDKRIDFAIIGPEAPLMAGLADLFEADGIKSFGPIGRRRTARRLQGLRQGSVPERGIPTAAFRALSRCRIRPSATPRRCPIRSW